MKKTAIVAAATALLVTTSAPALAEKLTVSCTFAGGYHVNGIGGVNQVFIDTDRPLVDLRVAQTMGTSDPRNFLYQNSSDSSIRFIAQASWISNGSWISFAATHDGMAFVIGYNKRTGELNWISADGNSTQYRCRP